MTSVSFPVPLRRHSFALWLRRPGVITATLLVAAVGLRLWTPSDDSASGVCLFRRCTGTACPGCGLTRALAYLLRGDLAAMWAMHPLAPLFAVDALAVAVLVWIGRAGRRPLRAQWVALWAGAHLPLLLGVWLWRSLGGLLPI